MISNKTYDEITDEIIDIEVDIFKVIEGKSFASAVTAMGFVMNKVIRKHLPKNHWGISCEEFSKILKESISDAHLEECGTIH